MLVTVLNYFIKLLYKKEITLLIVISFFYSQNAFSFQNSRLENYIQNAKSQKLWTHPQWIKLGHYEKNFDHYSSPFTQGLFLHPKGHLSPEKELIATIEVLYGDNSPYANDLNKHPQCKYLARTQWLNSVLNTSFEDQIKCVEMDQWKKELNVTTAAVIFASGDMGNASSSFGHTFLKIINAENARNKDLIDYGINYAANANANEGVFYALKGLMGFYPGEFRMLPYHQKLREYLNLEGRDVWEYHLNFTPSEVEFLLNHLLEMQEAKAPYYYFSDNCSYQILKTLEVVRPNLNLSEDFKYFTIPMDTIKKLTNLKDNKIISFTLYKKSLKTDYLESYSKLNNLQKKAVDDAVVKLDIPLTYELSPKEKAEVFETAMKFYSLQAYNSKNDYENEKYSLYLKRAALGQLTQEDKSQNVLPPEKSHDSSAFYLGYGLLDTPNKQIPYLNLKFRNALHELEQNDAGVVPYSHLEMASLEAKIASDRNPDQHNDFNKILLSRFTILNLINLNPVTQLDKHVSWKFRAEFVNNEFDSKLSSLRPDIEAAGGYSFDLDLFKKSRIGYFINLRHWSNYFENNDYKYLNSLSPEILFITRLSDNLTLSADLNYYTHQHAKPFFKYKTKANYNFLQNYDAQFIVENEPHQTTNYMTQIIWNFTL